MPSSTVLGYSGGAPSVMPRSGLDASLILNRASAITSAQAPSSALTRATLGIGLGIGVVGGLDSTLLNLELKRHERRRQLMKYGGKDDDDLSKVNNLSRSIQIAIVLNKENGRRRRRTTGERGRRNSSVRPLREP